MSGYSDIGKSSVVNELHKVIVLPRGIFISGKFDLRLRDIPYLTLAQAFAELIRQILNGQYAEIAHWRDVIEEAIGQHGRLLTDLIPELASLIGVEQNKTVTVATINLSQHAVHLSLWRNGAEMRPWQARLRYLRTSDIVKGYWTSALIHMAVSLPRRVWAGVE